MDRGQYPDYGVNNGAAGTKRAREYYSEVQRRVAMGTYANMPAPFYGYPQQQPMNIQQPAYKFEQHQAPAYNYNQMFHYDQGQTSQGRSKRSKVRENNQIPSKVIHIRNLPPAFQDTDVFELCQRFGLIEKRLFLHRASQAFVQMGSVAEATKAITHYQQNIPHIGSRPLYFQYSSHQELNVSESNAPRKAVSEREQKVPQGKVLLVSILNDTQPVTIENLHEDFSTFGTVVRIVTFMKTNSFKALIEMGDVTSASTAMHTLQYKDLFPGSCTLSIGYSQLQQLSVKQQGPRSRDFTLPNATLPVVPQIDPFGNVLSAQQPANLKPAVSPMPGMMHMGRHGHGIPGAVLLVNNIPEDKFSPNALFILFGVYGNVQRIKILYKKQDTALVQFVDPFHAQNAMVHLNQLPLCGKHLVIKVSRHTEVQLPDATKPGADLTQDYTHSPLHRFKGPNSFKNVFAPGRVVFLSGLPDDATLSDIHALMGDKVEAVKLFQHDHKMAFVKCTDTEAAVEKLIELHNTELRGRHIRLAFSNKPPDQVLEEDTTREGASLPTATSTV